MKNFVEVKLKAENDFLKVVETLTRIGVPSNDKKTLFQSCHILHKQGKYYIVHFKEMFILDGKHSSLTESDIVRRNSIANLLQDWGLVEIVDKTQTNYPMVVMKNMKIVNYKDKENWQFKPKYNIGRKGY